MKRITFTVNEELHRALKLAAVKRGKTIKEIATDLFERWLKKAT